MRRLKVAFVWAIVLALVAAIGYLLSESNSRNFSLELRGNELFVMRGRLLPKGFVPYEPDDRVLARAYAPLPLAGYPTASLDLTAVYTDRDQVDRALFKLIDEMVEVRAESPQPERLADAIALLGRARLLGGITEEQRNQLKTLEAKVAFFEGKARLDDAVVAVREAADKLKLASDSPNAHATDASELYERIAGLADQLVRAARLPLGSIGAEPKAGAAVEAKAAPAEQQPVPAEAPIAGERQAPPPAGQSPAAEPAGHDDAGGNDAGSR
jgi:hypothetical protein